jgi:hypothetical protein
VNRFTKPGHFVSKAAPENARLIVPLTLADAAGLTIIV